MDAELKHENSQEIVDDLARRVRRVLTPYRGAAMTPDVVAAIKCELLNVAYFYGLGDEFTDTPVTVTMVDRKLTVQVGDPDDS